MRKKSATVATVLRSNPLNVAFRRSLVGNNLQAWHNLVAKIVNVQLTDQRDTFFWSLTQNGHFTVRSMYRTLIARLPAPRKNLISKLRLPLKLRFLSGIYKKRVVLTKDNLARRQMEGKYKVLFL